MIEKECINSDLGLVDFRLLSRYAREANILFLSLIVLLFPHLPPSLSLSLSLFPS